MVSNDNSNKLDDILPVRELLLQFTSFMNSLDGSPDAFTNAEPIIDKVFDPSWTFMTEDGPKNLEWYRNFCKSFAENGNIAKVTYTGVKRTEHGIQVTIKNTVGGVEIDHITYDGTIIVDSNGQHKINYFEPVTTKDTHMANVGKMIQLNAGCDGGVSQDEVLLRLYSSFINSFDGSPNAFANAEPIMDKLFDSALLFMTDEGPKDLVWYRSFAKSFATGSGNKAEVTDIKKTENGIQVIINNTVAGVEIDPITYNGTIVINERGQYKIKHFAPVSIESVANDNNMENVGKMIQLVEETANGCTEDYQTNTNAAATSIVSN